MTLQQLKYITKIAETGSINLASNELFVSQPNLSKAVVELESEMNIKIFIRTNKGVVLTDDGVKFLAYARQVLESANILENQYKKDLEIKRSFSVSCQHYSFSISAFSDLVRDLSKSQYEFSIRETRTKDIIDDVTNLHSKLGIIYYTDFNKDVILRELEKNNLKYNILVEANPHVFISKNHPLANKDIITLHDLSDYPRLSFDQGIYNSFYFNEEPHSNELAKKSIVVTDRATLFNLLLSVNGYTISSGILSTKLDGSDIIARPLKSNLKMNIIYIYNPSSPLDEISNKYIEYLKKYTNV